MHPIISRPFLTAVIKGGILCLTAVAVVAAARVLEIESLQEAAWVDRHLRSTSGLLTFLAITAFGSAIGIPRQALAFLGGYAFGGVYGLAWTSLGLVLGCACGFFYSRMLGRGIIQRRLGERIRSIDAFLCSNPFLMAVMIRFFPIGNNALANLAAGVTSIPALPFILGSGVGYLPQTIVFVLLGSGVQLGAEVRIILSSLLFIATSLLGVHLFYRFRADRKP